MLKTALVIYSVLTTLIAVVHAFAMARVNDGWYIGDWSINYSAGFIRRGFAGFLVHAIHLATSVPAQWIVFAISTFLYLYFVYVLVRTILAAQLDWLKIALLVSPATLGFFVFTPTIGFRKEVMLFALLAWVTHSDRVKGLGVWLGIMLAIVAVSIVLSHEALVAFLPYVLAALFLRLGDIRSALRASWLAAVACAVACGFVLAHPGTVGQTMAICASIGGTYSPFGYHGSNICAGAVQWLQIGLPVARHFVQEHARSNNYLRVYSALAVVALAPAVLLAIRLYRVPQNRQKLQVIASCALVSFCATSVLFYSAIDWGRWIYIHTACLLLILLGLPSPHTHPSSVAWRYLRPLLLTAYAVCWALPAAYVQGNTAVEGYLYILRAHL